MVDFRKGITALSMLALFTGLASAQVNTGGNQQLTCSTQVTAPTQARAEGFTELTGDIVITCTGGVALPPGSQVPTVNFTVYYNANVTSRLLPTTTNQTSSTTSEALLLIDEPGSGLTGFGPGLPQTLCTTPLTGCNALVGFPVNPSTGVASATTGSVTSGSTPAPNVYQGWLPNTAQNSVTFFGVPVLAPTTTGSRVFRITNVRINATTLAGGSASGASQIQASIAVSNPAALSISNNTPNVGIVVPGLSTSASSAANLSQCSSQTKSSVNTISFSENFGTAFKTRVQASSNSLYAGQINAPNQNMPGTIYNSESGLVIPISSNQIAGLADFGTRLKATFNNIPTGTRIFVSTVNVYNNANAVSTATPPVPPSGGLAGSNTGNGNVSAGYVGLAQLINGENTSDGNAGVSGFFPAVTASDNGPDKGTVPIAEVGIINNSGSAVWEVVNTNPNTNETFKFAVYTTYSANVAQNAPLPGTSTVNLSFAPTTTSGAASSSASIPRFTGDSNAGKSIFTINICRTILLYPYITNQAGFDTGLTIANTSLDSFTTGSSATGAQSGSCKLTYYGGTTAAPTTPPGPGDTGNIPAGTVWVATLQTIAPNFQGYMFAVCNFQYAHGFAFISDVGARNLAMGYLAVVLNDPGTGGRSNTNTTTSENGAH